MSEFRTEGYEDFSGTQLDAHRARLDPSKFQVDQNGDRFDRGTWKRRRGHRRLDLTKQAAAIRSLIGVELPGTDYGLVAISGANAVGRTNAAELSMGGTPGVTSLSTGLDTTHRYDVAEFRRLVYLANGWTKMRRWDGLGTSLTTAGIAGPSVEPDSWTPSPTTGSGSTSVGVHRFRYRYQDSTTGYVSNPSEEREITVTAASAGQLTFSISTSGASNILRSSDSKVDTIILEATPAGGEEFYTAATVLESASSVVCSVSDAGLTASLLPYGDYGHDVPPVSRYVVSHRERLWLFGQVVHSEGTIAVTGGSTDATVTGTSTLWDTEALGSASGESSVAWLIKIGDDSTPYEIDYAASATSLELKDTYPGSTASGLSYQIYSRANVIWVSRAGFPESFQPLKFLNGPNGEGSGDITAGIGFGPVMVFFSLAGMHRISWDLDPLEDPVVTQVSSKRGALNQRVVIEVEGKVYSMDRTGWHVWSGVFPTHVSRPVDALLDSIDFSLADNFHCVWLPRVRAIRWYVCFSGDTYPSRYLQLDVDTGAWGTGLHEVEISESRLVPSAAGPQVYLGDENGYVHVADTGNTDGGHETYSHLVVDAGASTTSIPTTGLTLPTTGLGGVMAYWVEGDESKLVTSSTSTTLTTAAFSSAPEEGDRIWLGRIVGKLKTRAFSRRSMRHVQRARYAWFVTEPTTASRRARVRVYEDLSATAKSGYGWVLEGENMPGLTAPGHEDTVAGKQADHWLIHTDQADGMVKVPFGGEFRRAVEIELEVDEPAVDFELSGLSIGGEAVERAD